MESAGHPKGTEVAGEQHSAKRTIALHLLPGVLVTLFYIAIAPVMRSLGFPSLMGIFLAVVLVLIPFELGFRLYEARKSGSSPGASCSTGSRCPGDSSSSW